LWTKDANDGRAIADFLEPGVVYALTHLGAETGDAVTLYVEAVVPFDDSGTNTHTDFVKRSILASVDWNGPWATASTTLADDTVRFATAMIPPPQPGAPDTPSNFVVTPSAGGITLTWDANTEPNLAGYHLSRWDAASQRWLRLNDTILTDTSYVDGAIPSSSTAYYVLVAVNTTNRFSEPTFATTGDNNSVPLPPLNVQVNVLSNTEAVVTWQHDGPNEDGFAIWYREDRSDASWNLVEAGVNALSSPLPTLEQSTDYEVLVSAYNASGESDSLIRAFSTLDPVLNDPVIAPSSLTATPGDGQVVLTWPDAADNEIGYVIERRTDADWWSIIGETNANATSYVDSIGLSTQATYQYRIFAYSSDEISLKTSSASVTLTAENGLPAPDLTLLQNVNGAVVLGWNTVLAADETLNIYVGASPDFVPTPTNRIASEVDGHLWTDRLGDGSELHYKATIAKQQQGESQASTPMAINTDASNSPPPVDIDAANPLDVESKYSLQINPVDRSNSDVVFVGFYGAGEFGNPNVSLPNKWGNERIQILAKELGGTIRRGTKFDTLPYRWIDNRLSLNHLGAELDQNGDRRISTSEANRNVRIFGWSLGGT